MPFFFFFYVHIRACTADHALVPSIYELTVVLKISLTVCVLSCHLLWMPVYYCTTTTTTITTRRMIRYRMYNIIKPDFFFLFVSFFLLFFGGTRAALSCVYLCYAGVLMYPDHAQHFGGLSDRVGHLLRPDRRQHSGEPSSEGIHHTAVYIYTVCVCCHPIH